jgi:secreted Zn-dependent insulinase-like peptidase
MYFQVGVADLEREVLMDMMCQMIREPAYDYLRTKKQLGYDLGVVSGAISFNLVGCHGRV